MNNRSLMEFLEAVLKDTLESSPKEVVVAYLDDNGDVKIAYHKCNYADLQHIGQEILNEGIMRLIAKNEDRMQELRDEDTEEK